MEFSVVVLTFNSQRYIKVCLESLVNSFRALGCEYEIFVIDNNSLDSSRELTQKVADEFGANIKLIALDRNTGTTYSRNLGLKQASGKNIIVLDSDAYVNPEALSGLSQYLKAHPGCGMVVPKLIYPDGRFQMSTDIFPTLLRKFQRLFLLKKMEKKDVHQACGAHPVDYAISAFWMFPKKILERVGLLDEKIFYAPEDVDYCLRIWKAGYTIDYFPEYNIVHDAQELSRGIKINRFTFLHVKGLLYYFIKHRYCWRLNGLYREMGRGNG